MTDEIGILIPLEERLGKAVEDIADSLRKIANPLMYAPGSTTFRVRFGDTVGVYDKTTGKLLEKIKDAPVDWKPGLEDPR